MKNNLRTRIYNGLYLEEFEYKLIQGCSFSRISRQMNLSKYTTEICKWYLYNKYEVFNRRGLVAKLRKM